eukprot:GHRQ01030964.1.p1 GENE.GHRQ01030964.1~~GHRQ01030964.1.p1  ORF type:complete len:194 (+),score=86.28 GHRQ01030964.1:215-796(+)
MLAGELLAEHSPASCACKVDSFAHGSRYTHCCATVQIIWRWSRLYSVAQEAPTCMPPVWLQVRLKDERLRQLRGAIKALEGKLAQLLKDKTDLVMQASSWLEQEQLDERMAELHAHKAALAADLAAAQAELAAARQAAAGQDATLRKLSEQLLKEGEAASRLKGALAREAGLVKALRAKMNKVGGGSQGRCDG